MSITKAERLKRLGLDKPQIIQPKLTLVIKSDKRKSIGYAADSTNEKSIEKIKRYCLRHNLDLIDIYHEEDTINFNLEMFMKIRSNDKPIVIVNKNEGFR